MGLRTIAFRLSTPSYIFSASLRISPFGTISKVFSFPFSAMSRWADNLTDLEKGREGEEFKGKEEGEGERSEWCEEWLGVFLLCSLPLPSLYVRTICRVLVIYRLPYLAVGNVMWLCAPFVPLPIPFFLLLFFVFVFFCADPAPFFIPNLSPFIPRSAVTHVLITLFILSIFNFPPPPSPPCLFYSKLTSTSTSSSHSVFQSFLRTSQHFPSPFLLSSFNDFNSLDSLSALWFSVILSDCEAIFPLPIFRPTNTTHTHTHTDRQTDRQHRHTTRENIWSNYRTPLW